jgi:hypothetical protein
MNKMIITKTFLFKTLRPTRAGIKTGKINIAIIIGNKDQNDEGKTALLTYSKNIVKGMLNRLIKIANNRSV